MVAVLRDGQDILDIALSPGAARCAGQALCGLHATWCQYARRPFRTGCETHPSADEAAMVTLFDALAHDHAAHADALLLWMLRPAGHAQARQHACQLIRALGTMPS